MGPLEDTRDSTLPGLLAHVSLRKNLITLLGQGDGRRQPALPRVPKGSANVDDQPG